jgi:hypothetical protein
MKTSFAALMIATLSVSYYHNQATAANSTFYGDLVSFSAAASGPLVTQDFSFYPHGTDLRNVQILPGVRIDSNLESVEAFSAGGTRLFGFGGTSRADGDTYYDVNLSLPHRAVAFDLTGFDAVAGDDSTAQGPGLMTVFFSDATSDSLLISGNGTFSDTFFGVVSDTPITKIRWEEALEGSGGNEETGIDNVSVVRGVVPEPCSSALASFAVLATLLFGRRRMAANS